MALTEATLALAQISKGFRLWPTEQFENTHPKPRATLKPSGPVLTNIERR